MSGARNLAALWRQRDEIDETEGRLAYVRYRKVMARFAAAYGIPVKDVTSAFVALSPNSDYHGNLRSLASVLAGAVSGTPKEQITVSTYNACRDRAYGYVVEGVDFLRTVRGPKIRAFRDNILRPKTSPAVTVDGHMIAAWAGEQLTMKEAAARLRRKADYNEIADGIRELAAAESVAPRQAQAILWLTRKRVFGVKYSAQLELFAAPGDAHRTLCDPRDFPPYPNKKG